MSPKVSIIVPVHNQVDYTRDCLNSLFADPELGEDIEIVVVDNGSDDSTAELLAARSADNFSLRSIRLEKNKGIAAACNAGAESSSAEELVFLSNETVAEKGWLTALRNTLRIPGVGIVAPKLLHAEDRTISHAGYVYSRERGGFYPLYLKYPNDFSGVCRRREFQAVLGACILIKRDVFEKIGRFSEIELEDIDLCLRVREIGLRVIYEPRSILLRHESGALEQNDQIPVGSKELRRFSDRWPTENLLWDDRRYYAEDGFTIKEITDEAVFLDETVTSSFAFLDEARGLISLGEHGAAAEKLIESIALYLGNETSFQELIHLLIEQDKLAEAADWAESMALHTINFHSAKLLSAVLLFSLSRTERAKDHLTELTLDWTTPVDVLEKAEELLRSK